jgi:alkylated DNA repair dioxygenase AlkB
MAPPKGSSPRSAVRGKKTVTPSSEILSEDETNGRVIATFQTIKSNNCWAKRQKIRFPEIQKEIVFNLHRGGCMNVYPALVSIEKCNLIKDELLNSGYFRRYQIQGNDEPRAHFLLHEDASDDFEDGAQPGYKYARVTLKSRPLSDLEWVQDLSLDMENHCGIDKWTIGVNPVIYRDGNDRMGDHSDDDQGEELILAVVIDAPASADKLRRVHINAFKKLDSEEGDEDIELFLRPGDAYLMDGEMQKFYSHSVPPAGGTKQAVSSTTTEETKEEKEEESILDTTSRIVIVFRTGNCVYFTNDTGRSCPDLTPQPKATYRFGSLDWLVEGRLYSRADLWTKGGHLGQQRGLSGNKQIGCDAIVVSGLREDGLGVDELTRVMYAVESSKGAESVVTSFKNALPIRIFRSTRYNNRYGAKVPGMKEETRTMRQMYRYDGVYWVYEFVPPLRTGGPYMFFLERCIWANRIPNHLFRSHCEDLDTLRGENGPATPMKRRRRQHTKIKCDDSGVAPLLTLQKKVKTENIDNLDSTEYDHGDFTLALPMIMSPPAQNEMAKALLKQIDDMDIIGEYDHGDLAVLTRMSPAQNEMAKALLKQIDDMDIGEYDDAGDLAVLPRMNPSETEMANALLKQIDDMDNGAEDDDDHGDFALLTLMKSSAETETAKALMNRINYSCW